MPVIFSPIYDTTLPIEVQGVLPESFTDKKTETIQRFKVWLGNKQIEFGELFKVTGKNDNEQFFFEGDIQNVHWLGANMTRGSIIVNGSTGRHLGSGISGGEIIVQGNTSSYTANESRGGLVKVNGNVGDWAGCFYPGSRIGMNGGTLLVKGNAGKEVGSMMRRGIIAIEGDAGPGLGHNMRAGSILVFGQCGEYPGVGMRRGTIGLIGRAPTKISPTFARGGNLDSVVVSLIARHLTDLQFEIAQKMSDQAIAIFHGDMLEGGRGEMWVAN